MDTNDNYAIYEDISVDNFVMTNNYKICSCVNIEDTAENYGLIYGRRDVSFTNTNNAFGLVYNKPNKTLSFTHWTISRVPYTVDMTGIELNTNYKVEILKDGNTLSITVNETYINSITGVGGMNNNTTHPLLIGSLYDRYGTQMTIADIKFRK